MAFADAGKMGILRFVRKMSLDLSCDERCFYSTYFLFGSVLLRSNLSRRTTKATRQTLLSSVSKAM